MKRLFFASAFLIVALYGIAQDRSEATVVIKKVSAKDIRTIMDTSTGPVIINFWATWCGPCIREIPWFDSIISKKNTPVKLLLVNLNFSTDYPGRLTDFVKNQGYKGEVVFLSETNANYFIPAIDKKWKGVIPASVFINNSKKYYQFFNQQLPPRRFELELDKLVQ